MKVQFLGLESNKYNRLVEDFKTISLLYTAVHVARALVVLHSVCSALCLFVLMATSWQTFTRWWITRLLTISLAVAPSCSYCLLTYCTMHFLLLPFTKNRLFSSPFVRPHQRERGREEEIKHNWEMMPKNGWKEQRTLSPHYGHDEVRFRQSCSNLN